MKIIQRLYLKDFLKLLLLISGGLSVIFSLLEIVDKIGYFMPGKSSVASLLLYAFFSVPKLFLYVLPMSVLTCSLFTFSQAVHRKEITAIKAAGGKLRSLSNPFIVMGIFLSLFAFITGEFIVPDFSNRAANLKNFLEGKSRRLNVTEGGLWLRSKDGSPVKIDLYVAERKTAEGVSVFVLGDDSLKEKIVAAKARWNGETWIFEDVSKYNVSTGSVEHFKTITYGSLESPDFFEEDLKGAAEMGIAELYRYTQRLKRAGFRNLKLAVDLHSKISFPLVSLFMMILGMALSLRMRLGGGLFSAGLGLLISLLYWLSYTFSLSMGYSGVIPALISAWTVPLIFSALAIYLFFHIPE